VKIQDQQGGAAWSEPIGIRVTPPVVTTGAISGTVYSDANDNGVRDPGEAGVAGRVIYIDANRNGVVDPNDKRSATTDAAGNYAIAALPPGSYRVREVLEGIGGVRMTSPTSGYFELKVVAGKSATANFGNTSKAQIRGKLFDDTDGNGQKGAGESTLTGWRVYLDTDKDGAWDSNEVSTLTDPGGIYTFRALASGSYRIREVLPKGWRIVRPSGMRLSPLQRALPIVRTPPVSDAGSATRPAAVS
jgi:hypothetical protein